MAVILCGLPNSMAYVLILYDNSPRSDRDKQLILARKEKESSKVSTRETLRPHVSSSSRRAESKQHVRESSEKSSEKEKGKESSSEMEKKDKMWVSASYMLKVVLFY